jgi:predicted ATPase
MGKIDYFNITGFRRLQDVNIPMRGFMALIGANGVGKTSFLDAFTLLAASASGNLSSTLSNFGGIANLLTRGRSEFLSLQISMDISEAHPLEYSLSLQPHGSGYIIAKENVSQLRGEKQQPFKYIDSSGSDMWYYDMEKKNLVRPAWEHNPQETSLSQAPRMFPESEELRRTLASAAKYHILDVGQRAPVKLPQTMKPAFLPGAQGEDLVSFLFSLRESDRNHFDMITDSLKAAFPDFEELNFPPVAAGMLAMTWKDRNFSAPVYMHELSEGTIRFLWLVALLHSPALPGITMIDEPEVSLHPEMLSILADVMREASMRTQLIVSTHSDRLISFLSPEEIVVMDMDEKGCAMAQWADTMDLDEWLKEYSLDELWRMGQMGGRP